jgi:acetate---CoA ligase (ADP-forming)
VTPSRTRPRRSTAYRSAPTASAVHEASVVKALIGLSDLMADAAAGSPRIDVNSFQVNAKAGVDALIALNNAVAKAAVADD